MTVILNTFASGGHAAGDVMAGFENAAGGAFNDFFRGDGQANTLDGRDGSDFLQGRGGDDLLIGGLGGDILEGGLGNDTLDGGDGSDFVSLLDATVPTIFDFGNLALSAPEYANDTLISIENVIGSATAANTLVGDGQDNVLVGGSAGDLLFGGVGRDVLVGLEGDDTLEGGGARDTFLAGLGNDTMTGGSAPDTFLFEDDGQDVITDFSIGGSDLLLFFAAQTPTFGDLSFSTDGNGDAVISYGALSSSVTLEGVTEAEINPTPGTAPAWILIV